MLIIMKITLTNNEEVFSFFSVAHMDQFFINQQTEIEEKNHDYDFDDDHDNVSLDGLILCL